MTNPFFSKKSSAASPERHENPSTKNVKEHTPEQFKALAEQLLQDLRTQQQNSRTLQSSLPLLLKHYAFDQSYLDQAARWYTQTAWWYEKVGVFLLLTSSSALIGLTVSAAIVPVFATLALGFLFVTQFLLQQHGDITTRRERRLAGNIERMEHDMSDALLILEKAEQQAMDILVSLAELCRESASHLDTFVTQVASVQVQADAFASTVAQLGDVNETLRVHHQDVDDAFHQICGVLSESSLTLTQQPGALQNITQQLDETHLSLVTNSHTLTDLCAALTDQVVSLSSLTPTHRPPPAVLSAGQPKRDADGSRTSLSDETVMLNKTTHALLEDGDDFLEQLQVYRLKRTPSTDSPSSVNGAPVSPLIDKAHALTQDPSTKSTPFRH